MYRYACVATNLFLQFSILLCLFYEAQAQQVGNACLVHDHSCIYHGIGRAVGTTPGATTSLTATANWNRPNDFDLHGLLPQTETYTAPLEAIPGFPLNPSAPFFPDVSGAHIYPNHYKTLINGGAATATHSGDDGGGVATYPGQLGCLNQTGISCESIGIVSDVATGVYSYALHAFPDTGTTFDPTQYELNIQATGNLVLVMEQSDANQLTGTIQGASSQSAQIDVFVLNVGNAGHVGGVLLPNIATLASQPALFSLIPHATNLFGPTNYFEQQFRVQDARIAEIDRLRAIKHEQQKLVAAERQRQQQLAVARENARLQSHARWQAATFNANKNFKVSNNFPIASIEITLSSDPFQRNLQLYKQQIGRELTPHEVSLFTSALVADGDAQYAQIIQAGKEEAVIRAGGVLQTVGGCAEAAAGAVGTVASAGVTTILVVNGVDNCQAGVRTAYTGDSTHTFFAEGAGATAESFGASPETAENFRTGAEVVSIVLSVGATASIPTKATSITTKPNVSDNVVDVVSLPTPITDPVRLLASRNSGVGTLTESTFAQVKAAGTKEFSSEGQEIFSELVGTPIKTVQDLTDAIKTRKINPADIKVDFVLVNDQPVIHNTRTSTALSNAGIPRNEWNGINQTGNLVVGNSSLPIGTTYDDLVQKQIIRNDGPINPTDW